MTALSFQFEPMPWMRDAPCSGAGDVFFAQRGRNASKLVAQAKAVCAGCPVRETCLAYALESRQRFGVWGGRTVKERNRIIRGGLPIARPKPPPAECATQAGYMRHYRDREPACDPCKQAHARAEEGRRVARRESAA